MKQNYKWPWLSPLSIATMGMDDFHNQKRSQTLRTRSGSLSHSFFIKTTLWTLDSFSNAPGPEVQKALGYHARIPTNCHVWCLCWILSWTSSVFTLDLIMQPGQWISSKMAPQQRKGKPLEKPTASGHTLHCSLGRRPLLWSCLCSSSSTLGFAMSFALWGLYISFAYDGQLGWTS